MAGDVTGRRSLRALAMTLLVGTVALASPAQAQFFGWSGWDNGGALGGMPGPQVRRSITEQGFRVLGPLRRNGNVFVADVIDPRGRHERLIVASSDAQILQRFYVDDGRGSGPGPFARGDDEGGLIPPADIPGASRARVERPRRFAEPPADPAEPARRFGSPDTDSPDTAVVEPPPLRGQPPIKTVKPAPRVVERAPETPQRREPAAVDATPFGPKPRAVEPLVRAAPPKAPTPATVASRPDATPPPAAPAPDVAPSPQPHRLTDPLAIPGGSARSADPAPARTVSGSVAGAPAPVVKPAEGAAAKPAESQAPKTGDVPAAPLD